MGRRKVTSLTWIFLILLFTLVLSILAEKANGQVPQDSSVEIRIGNLRPIGAAAITTCDKNLPVIVLDSTTVLDTEYLKYVLIHEYTHVTQFRKVGCVEHIRRYNSEIDYHFKIEAEAYCAAYTARKRDGRATHDDWLFLLINLYRNLPQGTLHNPQIPCEE